MTDLKPYFDRAKADSDEVTRLQNELNAQFNSGTDEGIQAAIDLQPALEAAIIKAEQSNKIYLTMRNADNNTSNAAALFVSENSDDPSEDEKKVTLAQFNAMSPRERLKFSKDGGKIEG